MHRSPPLYDTRHYSSDWLSHDVARAPGRWRHALFIESEWHLSAGTWCVAAGTTRQSRTAASAGGAQRAGRRRHLRGMAARSARRRTPRGCGSLLTQPLALDGLQRAAHRLRAHLPEAVALAAAPRRLWPSYPTRRSTPAALTPMPSSRSARRSSLSASRLVSSPPTRRSAAASTNFPLPTGSSSRRAHTSPTPPRKRHASPTPRPPTPPPRRPTATAPRRCSAPTTAARRARPRAALLWTRCCRHAARRRRRGGALSERRGCARAAAPADRPARRPRACARARHPAAGPPRSPCAACVASSAQGTAASSAVRGFPAASFASTTSMRRSLRVR